MDFPGSVEETHNKVRSDFCFDYLDPQSNSGRNFRIFKGNCHIHLDNVERTYDVPELIFDALERKGKLGPGNYKLLKDLVRNVDMKMLEYLQAAEERIGEISQMNGHNSKRKREN